MTEDFYRGLVNEAVAEIEAATKGMSEIERKEYFLRSAQEHVATLHALKASRVLIEQAEQHVARLTNELAELKRASEAEAP